MSAAGLASLHYLNTLVFSLIGFETVHVGTLDEQGIHLIDAMDSVQLPDEYWKELIQYVEDEPALRESTRLQAMNIAHLMMREEESGQTPMVNRL